MPNSLQKPSHSRNTTQIPRVLTNFVVWTDKSKIHPYGICANSLHPLSGIYHIPLAFAHLLSIGAQYQTSVQSLHIGLAFTDQAHIEKRLVEKSGVEEMHCIVFRSARISLDGHPIFHFFLIRKFFQIMRITIPQKIPRRIYESVHRV